MQLQSSHHRISRDQLRLRVNRAAAELRSKGTIEDPVAKNVGWTTERLDAFDSTLSAYPQENTQEIKQSATQEAKEAKTSAAKGYLGAAFATAGVVALAVLSPALGPVALGLSAAAIGGGGAISLFKAVTNSENSKIATQTVADLDKWERSFAARDSNLGTLSDPRLGLQLVAATEERFNSQEPILLS